MIAFSCSHCGMKFQVKDEFAGRAAKRPACKQPLVVPQPSATVPWTPPAQLDGEKSSLAQAGLDPGVTLERGRAGGVSPRSSVSEALAGTMKSKQRYLPVGEIARGGMGAVLRAVDRDIRREIAVKYLLDEKDPPGQHLQRFGVRARAWGGASRFEAGQHHAGGFRRGVHHGLGAGEGAGERGCISAPRKPCRTRGADATPLAAKLGALTRPHSPPSSGR
jgi:hypothetical protein